MKTDALFYELFRHWPGVALQLAGLDPSRAHAYEFRSEEIKQTAFRLDGILAPQEDSDDPWLFLEVQFQPDDSLYRRLFAEIFLLPAPPANTPTLARPRHLPHSPDRAHIDRLRQSPATA